MSPPRTDTISSASLTVSGPSGSVAMSSFPLSRRVLIPHKGDTSAQTAKSLLLVSFTDPTFGSSGPRSLTTSLTRPTSKITMALPRVQSSVGICICFEKCLPMQRPAALLRAESRRPPAGSVAAPLRRSHELGVLMKRDQHLVLLLVDPAGDHRPALAPPIVAHSHHRVGRQLR